MTVSPCPPRVPPCPGHAAWPRVPVSLFIDTGHGHAPGHAQKLNQEMGRDPPSVSPQPTPQPERSLGAVEIQPN